MQGILHIVDTQNGYNLLSSLVTLPDESFSIFLSCWDLHVSSDVK